MEEQKNFIDFIRDAKKSKRLTRIFMEIKDEAELRTWFVSEGYEKITLDECGKLINYKKRLPRDIKEIIERRKAY
ncbi:MAG: hypothetical protein JRJ03_01380 [Deltaproteobacteria bacterium]|nr:hypothetical protein [Deltaproteobacteria bacterium]MBW2063560.1 hypothetical protein [Deltaproteobacteria bacterium]